MDPSFALYPAMILSFSSRLAGQTLLGVTNQQAVRQTGHVLKAYKRCTIVIIMSTTGSSCMVSTVHALQLMLCHSWCTPHMHLQHMFVHVLMHRCTSCAPNDTADRAVDQTAYDSPDRCKKRNCGFGCCCFAIMCCSDPQELWTQISTQHGSMSTCE